MSDLRDNPDLETKIVNTSGNYMYPYLNHPETSATPVSLAIANAL
jgi:hypothetical protein